MGNNPEHNDEYSEDEYEYEENRFNINLQDYEKMKELDPEHFKSMLDLENKFKLLDLKSQELSIDRYHDYEIELNKLEQDFIEKWQNTETDFWRKNMDTHDQITTKASNTFDTIKTMNIVIFIVGVVLISKFIIDSYLNPNSSDLIDFASLGVGSASFFSTWFLRPQNHISRAFGNFIQAQMIFKTHSAQWEYVKFYFRDALELHRKNNDLKNEYKKKGSETNDLKNIDESFKKLWEHTDKAVKLVEDYVEPKKDNGKEKKE